MDIRSIIDSEDHPPTRKPSMSLPVQQDYRQISAGFTGGQAPAHDNGREIRPPQPAPLQTSPYNDSHLPAASPHDNLRSPYQRAPSSGINNSQYATSHIAHQSPHHGQQTLQYPQREGSLTSGPQSGRSFGQSTPLSQTPTASTPGSASAYSNFPRPTSSHSIPTPNSVHNPSGFPQESPQPPFTLPRTSSQPQGAQHYISQPGTPLGPPTTYGRPVLYHHQDSAGEYRHRRSYSGSHHGQQESVGPSATTGRSPSAYRDQQPSVQGYHQLRERERSLSVSPKTKLPSLPSIDRMNSVEGPTNPDLGWNEPATSAKRKADVDITEYEDVRRPKLARKPSRSVGVSGLLNAEPPGESPERLYHSTQVKSETRNDQESEVTFITNNTLDQSLQPQSSVSLDRGPQQSHATSTQHSSTPQQYHPTARNHTSSDPMAHPPAPPRAISSFKTAALKASHSLIDAPLPSAKKTSRGPKKTKRSIQESSEPEVVEITELQSEPANKKPRIEESQNISNLGPTQTEQPPAQPKKSKVPRISRWQDIPIYAQSVRGPQRTADLFQQNLRGPSRGFPATTQPPHAAVTKHASQTNGTPTAHSQAPPQSSPPNGVPLSNSHPPLPSDGPLGPWEYSVTDTEPADEVTRILADFLFPNVVLNNEAGVAPAGGGRGLGAVLEIEAKIGRLIDRNTNDRLHLPVLNECVINQGDPNMRIAFESSMTENQHRNLNQFLNKALVDSQGAKQGSAAPRKPRIPMTYKHTHEIDTFYEINPQAALQLPRSVSTGLNLNPNARHKAKVRITTNEKTGEELAKIIKTRVADIDVYSPRTLFDWRISVNVEMDFDVEMKDLVAVEKRDGKADRRKDRVSYKHLKYQIDLTQVTPAEPANKMDKEHELEIEVSSEEVRKQGLLVMNNQPNGYEDLIKGFVDNVRLLARYCKE